ncbi:hypothetical protein HAX54_017589 [Datura stramonium]|uniref:Uncharacterized protein n=1 Tax=Datura stramonium TaxID=4076 RepID=A0ABS8S0K5_DATST|nr:hypothetical protein [Datura stramonium]
MSKEKELRMFIGVVWNCAAELKLVVTVLLSLCSLITLLIPSSLLSSPFRSGQLGGYDTFAVMGLASKPLHVYGKPSYIYWRRLVHATTNGGGDTNFNTTDTFVALTEAEQDFVNLPPHLKLQLKYDFLLLRVVSVRELEPAESKRVAGISREAVRGEVSFCNSRCWRCTRGGYGGAQAMDG